jgi:hypothetical protein
MIREHLLKEASTDAFPENKHLLKEASPDAILHQAPTDSFTFAENKHLFPTVTTDTFTLAPHRHHLQVASNDTKTFLHQATTQEPSIDHLRQCKQPSYRR